MSTTRSGRTSRVGAALAFVILVVVGRHVRPDASSAAITQGLDFSTLTDDFSAPLKLEGVQEAGVTRYAVRNQSGVVVAAGMSDAEVAVRFPEVRIPGERAGVGPEVGGGVGGVRTRGVR